MCRCHSDKKLILNELKVAQVMLKKSLVLMECNTSNMEVLKQTKQAEERLQKVSSMIMTNHIDHCILPIKRSKSIKDSIKKLLEVFKLVQKYNLTIPTT